MERVAKNCVGKEMWSRPSFLKIREGPLMRSLALFLVIRILITAPPPAQAEHPTHDDTRIDDLPAAKACLRELSDAEIESKIRGKRIRPRRDIDQRTVSYSEYFYENGEWINAREKISLQQIFGRWFVEGGKLCVRERDRPVACRSVLSGADGSIYMKDLKGTRRQSSWIAVRIESISEPR